MNQSRNELTRLLVAWTDGDANALEKLSEAVYNELLHVARHYMRGEHSGHTLQTTALVHDSRVPVIALPLTKPAISENKQFKPGLMT
jgi:hypothetical protein